MLISSVWTVLKYRYYSTDTNKHYFSLENNIILQQIKQIKTNFNMIENIIKCMQISRLKYLEPSLKHVEKRVKYNYMLYNETNWWYEPVLNDVDTLKMLHKQFLIKKLGMKL